MIVKALVTRLPEHGYSPSVLCLRGPGEIGRGLASSGVDVVSDLSKWRFDPAVLFRLRGIFRKHDRAGLIVLDHHDAIFWGAFASHSRRINQRILCIHSTGLWSKGKTFNRVDRMVIGAYDHIVALGEIHREYLSEREGVKKEKVALINNGVDTNRFTPLRDDGEKNRLRKENGIGKDDFVVTIVAALRPEKNHKMFIKTAAALSAVDNRFRFLIVGEGQMAGELKEMARKLLPEEKVLFLGRRTDTEKIFSLSDVSVLCSYPVVETFPLTVLEAMASEIPVIATSVGSIPEMLVDGEEGLLIESEDAGALARELLNLKQYPDLRLRLGRNARTRVVRDYSEDKMVSAYAALLDGVT